MTETSKNRRPRRQFDDDFKAQAVRLVLDEGKSLAATARDLDLTESALRQWVERARADRTQGRTGLTTSEREELARLKASGRRHNTQAVADEAKGEGPFLASTARCLYRRACAGRGKTISGISVVLPQSPSLPG